MRGRERWLLPNGERGWGGQIGAWVAYSEVGEVAGESCVQDNVGVLVIGNIAHSRHQMEFSFELLDEILCPVPGE
jgi:hypothetical protein